MAIKKSVRRPMLTWFTVLTWARVADTLECSGIHLNSLRATYWAVRRDLWIQRWRPGNSHSSTCHQCNPSAHSTGTTCGCHPPGRCWSGTGGPREGGTASSPSGTAWADSIVSREGREARWYSRHNRSMHFADWGQHFSCTQGHQHLGRNTHLGLVFHEILLHSSLKTLGRSGGNLLPCSTPRAFWTSTWEKQNPAAPFYVRTIVFWWSS